MKKVRSAVFCLVICCPVLSYAASNPEACVSIADRESRLDCFDSVFPQVDPMASEGADLAPIEARQQQEASTLHNWFSITPHKPNYILPFTHNSSSDYSPYPELGQYYNDTELKFQISLKTQLWPGLWRDSSLWAAYTQLSFWQLYAEDEASAPFRETNHEPELIWQIPADFRLLGMDARLVSLALVHQSNGQSDPLSRSWNRVTGQLVLEKNNFVFSAKSWVRIDNPEVDNNPNIEDYMGRIQLGAAYRSDKHTFALGLKNNLSSTNRSGVELSWTFPLAQHLKGYFQVYSGYGESLIDMENYSNRIGIGLSLTDWL